MSSSRLLTIKEAAEVIGCHPQSLYRDKSIPKTRVLNGRIRIAQTELDKYISARTIKTSAPQGLFPDPLGFNPALNTPRGYVISASGGDCEMPKGKAKSRLNLGYGAIYQRKTKQGIVRWYLDYRDMDGKRVQKVAPLAITKEDAALALQGEVRRTLCGAYGAKDQGQQTGLKGFVSTFIENYSKVNKRSWKDDKCRLQKLSDFFGDVMLSEVTPFDIERFKSSSLSRGLSKSTVNRYLAILRRMLNVAISWGQLKDNPVRQVKFYSEKDNLKERILSPEEEARLLGNSPEHLAPVLVVALNTGMRRGEILGLKWEQIDLQAREIKIVRTKSGKPRVVDINSVLFDLLRTLERRGKNERGVFLNPKTGKPYGKLQKSFRTACNKSGIKNLRFHDLRHTFASRLVERGADIIRVKELLGHSTVRITERYLHSNREERKKAVELLCQKPENAPQTPSSLWRICDTEKGREKTPHTISLFSVN
jgi:integrase